jgi:uncharacterized protein (DUF58 family)
VRIPKTSIRTTWRADWLIEFGIALVVLAFLTREIISAVIGAGILLLLASLGLLFHQRLGVLRGQLHVAERLPKTRVFLGDSIEGDLTIRNGSRLAAQILAVTPVVEKGLSFKLSSSSNQLLRPGTTSSSKFEIMPQESGRFQISGFTLTFADARGLFTGEVKYGQADSVQVYQGARAQAPLTPLPLYRGGPSMFRKASTGTDYADIRKYAPGDEYHRVEWKATARLRKLMVKEFHPEAQTSLQILVDAGRSMQQRSYVGSRIDEAFSVAQLLWEWATRLGDQVGLWLYDETEIVKAIKPVKAGEQLAAFRELALALAARTAHPEPTTSVVPSITLSRRTPGTPLGNRLAIFLRSLELKLGSGYHKTGIYRALAEAIGTAPGGIFIILTDFQTSTEAFAKTISELRGGGHVIVAHIGATWRMSRDLEEAFLRYQKNIRTIRDLQRLGMPIFDQSPERLIEVMIDRLSRGFTAAYTFG